MTSTPPITVDPFEDFQRITDNGIIAQIYKPSSEISSKADPGLILMCTWAFAQPKHIAKYIVTYRSLFPSSQILVLQNDIGNMLWRSDRSQRPLFQPVAVAIKDFLTKSKENGISSKILLHMFSNGGAHSAVQLAETYNKTFASEDESASLPISAEVLDSCPNPPNFVLAVKAVTMGLPKTALAQYLGPPLVWGVVGITGALHYGGISELAVGKVWRTMDTPNNPTTPFLRKDIPRTYIYSKEDAVIEWQVVLEHAAIARECLGMKKDDDTLIRTEEFVGSGHVNHLSLDRERYWKIVKATWEKAGA